MVKDKTLVRAMEGIVVRQGVQVRWERGAFQGGRCTLDGQEIIILNQRLPVEAHLRVLAGLISPEALNAASLRPAVRTAVEDLIKKMSDAA
ncbi:MAG: hypothetical protein OXM02_09445 [Bacteroidota bacterium]|nr:hypothetical protein [Bacteroidota bacterium]MDE2834726.1 hypothetical protein [Bacteroidota bacterium]MDE2956291.1 hypothetical protein [Bacteroidota bacterium]